MQPSATFGVSSLEMCSVRQECVETSGGPACVCAEGYEGSGCNTCSSGYRRVGTNQCELIPIDCATNPTVCGLHGTCTDMTSGDVCECDELYTGRLCELCESGYQDNDSDGTCHPTCAEAALDCKSPSHCSDTKGTAVCECPAGYAGDDCSRCSLGYRDTGTACVPTCAAAEMSCTPNQVCVDSPMGARCECAEGYTGPSCDSCGAGFRLDPSTLACLPSCDGAEEMCGEHGSCDDSVGFAYCVCDLGYNGDSCAECADDFQSGVGGACERTPGSTETLVMMATYKGRPILATIDPNTGAALPLAEPEASGIASGSDPETLFLNQAGTIMTVSLPGGTTSVAVASSGAVGPLTWDTGLSRLYALGGQAPFPVLSIDPSSKVVVELFDTDLAGVADLAFDATGNRLIALRDTLHAISLANGAVTDLGAPPPATVGIDVAADGTILALSATEADEATSRVQACRTTASRLGHGDFPSATGRFIEPAADEDIVTLSAASSMDLEVLSYLGRGGAAATRSVEITVDNPEAFICMAVEEPTLINVPATAHFRALVVYSADDAVELTIDAGYGTLGTTTLFLGGYAPNFTHPDRDDIQAYTPAEWAALKLPVDMRFHQPGPGVLHTLGAGLAVDASVTLTGTAIPAGALTSWTPVSP